jgi:hypothetical protein
MLNLKTSIIFLFFLLIFPMRMIADSVSDEPRIKQFRWSETPFGFHVWATLQRGFQRDIEEAIIAGIPTSFRYQLKFKQYRWYWDNKYLFDMTITHTVRYDTLRKIFTITKLRADVVQPYSVTTTEDITIMREIMSNFDAEVEISPKSIKEDRQYYFSLHAVIETENDESSWNSMLYWASTRNETPINRLWLPVKQAQ